MIGLSDNRVRPDPWIAVRIVKSDIEACFQAARSKVRETSLIELDDRRSVQEGDSVKHTGTKDSINEFGRSPARLTGRFDDRKSTRQGLTVRAVRESDRICQDVHRAGVSELDDGSKMSTYQLILDPGSGERGPNLLYAKSGRKIQPNTAAPIDHEYGPADCIGQP